MGLSDRSGPSVSVQRRKGLLRVLQGHDSTDLKHQNLNFASNKGLVCLFSVLVFQFNIALIHIRLFYNSAHG